MTIEQLRICPLPPLPHGALAYADADDKTRNWLYNGVKPHSPEEVEAVAAFCVRQKLPDALSWLVLQCELKELDLSYMDIYAGDLQMIASWLKHWPHPIGLDVSESLAGDQKNNRVVLVTLLDNSALTSLNISNNHIGFTNAELGAAIAMGPTNLDYSALKALDTCTVPFAHALQLNSTLTSLDFSDNRIGPTGAEAFAAALITNTALSELNFSKNDIGDEGAVAFANALKINSTLTSLNIADNNNQDIGEAALADALQTNLTLTDLDDGYLGEKCNDPYARRLYVNKNAKPLVLPAAEAFLALPTSWESKLPVEVGALIVKEMIVRAPVEGDGVEGLRSLVIANDIVKQRSQDATV